MKITGSKIEIEQLLEALKFTREFDDDIMSEEEAKRLESHDDSEPYFILLRWIEATERALDSLKKREEMKYITVTTQSGTAYKVDLYHNDWTWSAVEANYDGPEDRFRAATGDTREEALYNLIEKLNELEERESTRKNNHELPGSGTTEPLDQIESTRHEN